MREHLKSEVAAWLRWAEANHVDPDHPSVTDVTTFYFDVLPGKTMPVRQTLSTSLREHYGGPFNAVKLPYPLLTRYVGVTLNQIVEAAKALPPKERSWVLCVAVLRLKTEEADAWSGQPGTIRGVVRLEKRSVPVPYWVWDAVSVEAERPVKWPWKVADMHAALAAATADLPEITRVAVWGRWSAMRIRTADRRRGLFGRPVP